MIVSNLDPKVFAEAMAAARPRDLEYLAHSFSIIYELDPTFMLKVSDAIPQAKFFSSTAEEWRLQTNELQKVLVFFAPPIEMQPARGWVHANEGVIDGPLKTFFAYLAPEVAIRFHKTGKSVQLVNRDRPEWGETGLAILDIAALDYESCLAMVRHQLGQFEAALYHLNLGSLRGIVFFFRTLHELSPELFNELLTRLDLDAPAAAKTIKQLATNQPKERRAYIKLARSGKIIPGKLGELSTALLDRIERAEQDARAEVE